ncbi:MAG: redoxin domain-containing protein [Actinomycetota bacterium]|nr:redoxin domain-containing protein [Actinomycetota bacterium]
MPLFQRTSAERRSAAALRASGLVAAALLLVTGCASGTAEAGPSPMPPAAAAPAPAPAPAKDSDRPSALSFTATTLDGTTIDTSTLQGEPVVLWFWAPWCTICRAEASEVAEVAAEFDGKVIFLGVPGRGEEAAMRGFVADTGTGEFDHLVDADGSLWGRFGVVSQPTYAFVSADGATEVFGGALGGDELRTRAASLAAG